MLKMVTTMLALALIVGCTSKEEKALIKDYETHKVYHKYLQKTEKIQLYENSVTKVLLTATYLYKQTAKKNQNKDEVFVVGLYTEETESLISPELSLTLDGKTFKSIKVLEKNSPYLKDISFKSEWMQFYLVHFAHTNKKDFKLTLESSHYGKGTLHFAKVAKYVLTKKGF